MRSLRPAARTRSSHSTPRLAAASREKAAHPRLTVSSMRTTSSHGSVLQGGASAAASSAVPAAAVRYTSITGVSWTSLSSPSVLAVRSTRTPLSPASRSRMSAVEPARAGFGDHGVCWHGDHARPLFGGGAQAAFHDWLGEDPQAHHGIAHHQGGHRVLASERPRAAPQRHHGEHMRQVDGDDVAGHDGDHGGEPGEAGAHRADIGPIPRRAEEIPADAEGIRGQRDDELALDQEEGEVVGQVIRDGDGTSVNAKIGARAPTDLPAPLTRTTHRMTTRYTARNKTGKAMRPMVCAAIRRAAPGPGSRLKRISSSHAQAGVAMIPSKVTVDSMRRMKPIIERDARPARSRPTANGRRFNSRSASAARAKHAGQSTHSAPARQSRSQLSHSARRVTRRSVGAKRLSSPNASEKASPRWSQRSRPNRYMPLQVRSE